MARPDPLHRLPGAGATRTEPTGPATAPRCEREQPEQAPRGLHPGARLLDALVFSSLWLAAAAAALSAAAARALGAPLDPRVLGLAATGTLVVYNVDRLRDVERDRTTAPARTRFIERWRPALTALTLVAAAAAAVLAWRLGPRIALLLAPIAALGLLHRRLKHLPFVKAPYVAGAWVAVVVGLPWLLDPTPRRAAGTALLLFGAILANAMGSNVRDREALAARVGRARALDWARRVAGLTTLATCLAGPELRLLLPVPALTWLALRRFRFEERYAPTVLDGALLAGGALACALAASL